MIIVIFTNIKKIKKGAVDLTIAPLDLRINLKRFDKQFDSVKIRENLNE